MKQHFLTMATATLMAFGANATTNSGAVAPAATVASTTTTTETTVNAGGSDVSKMVKCYGISPKSKNDCASANGSHGCAGEAAINYDPCEWKVVSVAACNAGVKDPKTGAMMKGSQTPVNCKTATAATAATTATASAAPAAAAPSAVATPNGQNTAQ